MLHIIWVIIKIIGFLLIGIVGLLLGLVLVILFVPIRYRMKLSYYGEIKGIVKITWLLHMISVTISYDQDMDTVIRIFGIRLSKGKKNQVEEILEDLETELEEEFHQEQEVLENKMEQSFHKEEKIPVKDQIPVQEEKTPPKASLVQKLIDFLKRLRSMIFTFPVHLYEKLKNLASSAETCIRFIQNEANQKTFKRIVKNTKSCIRHLLPQKAQGLVTFGFDDPYTTGQVLSAASIFYTMSRGRLQFVPVFEEKILEGQVDLKGRIRIGTITFLLLQVYMNRNFRVLLKKWQNR